MGSKVFDETEDIEFEKQFDAYWANWDKRKIKDWEKLMDREYPNYA